MHFDSFTLRVVVAPPFFEVDILSEASADAICREAHNLFSRELIEVSVLTESLHTAPVGDCLRVT